MTTHHPNLREVLGDPLSHWLHAAVPRPSQTRPVVAMSRQPGARGGELAHALARELGLHVYDSEIVQKIAESAQLSERVVSILDEKDRSTLDDWLSAWATDKHLSPYGYLLHLTHVVTAIARLGGAVIVGRGSHLILQPREALRVLVVAPRRERIATVAARKGVSSQEAESWIAVEEAQRQAFLKKYFRADFGDVGAFDLVVNTAALGLSGAVRAVSAALMPAAAVRPVA